MKGPELALPEEQVFLDKEGRTRCQMRVRWWDLPSTAQIGELTLPEPCDLRGVVAATEMAKLPNYPADAPPIFFGHYWLGAAKERRPLSRNVACLDYSAASVGPLVAYRWEGEPQLCASRMVTTKYPDAA